MTDQQRENCFLTEVESKFLLDFRTDMPKTSSDRLDFYLSGLAYFDMSAPRFFLHFIHESTEREVALSGFLLPLFYCWISAAFPMKNRVFFPKIGQIIPKLIGLIVGKNPDLVTVSGNVFLYYAITYPVICALFITIFCRLGCHSFLT